MQITVNINANVNRKQLDRVAGDSIEDKMDTIVQFLQADYGVYASAGQTVTGFLVELQEGSAVDFIKGLETYKFF